VLIVPSVVVLEARDYTPGMRVSHQPLRAAIAWTIGLGCLGCASCSKSSAAAGPQADVTASEHGFTPTSLSVPSGGPGSHRTVTFVRTTDKTCATEVVFPDLNIEKKLPLNQVVPVDLPTDSAKTLTFQCGMAMYKGAVVVTAH
jgi:plastocyanin domain-containing protein